jgi:hypothetical protein
VPEDHRAEGLAAARRFVGESWFEAFLERLMPEIPRRFDHPWHPIIRQESGEALYRKVMASMGAEQNIQVAETQAEYGSAIRKPAQRGLFD